MRVYNRYTSEKLSDLKDSRLSDITAFLGSEKESRDPEDTLAVALSILESKKEQYSKTLASESGNPVTLSREEIVASIRLLRFASSNMHSDLRTSVNESDEFRTIEERAPKGNAVGITPRINPLYRFVELLVSSLLTGTKTVARPSYVGALTISEFWKEMNSGEIHGFMPAFMSSGGNNLKKLLSSGYVSSVIFTGSRESHLAVLKNSVPGTVSGTVRKKAYALVPDGADLDSAAKTVAELSLRGTRDPEFSPHRVLFLGDSFEYFTNRLMEESLKLRSGDPASPDTDVSCFLSGEQADAFTSQVDGELQTWGEQLTTPVRQNNSFSPAVFRASEKPGTLWNEALFGPFIIAREVESLNSAAEIIRSDSEAGSLFLFSSDANMLKYADRNTRLEYLFSDTPGYLGYEDIFKMENSLHRTMESMTTGRRRVTWK